MIDAGVVLGGMFIVILVLLAVVLIVGGYTGQDVFLETKVGTLKTTRSTTAVSTDRDQLAVALERLTDGAESLVAVAETRGETAYEWMRYLAMQLAMTLQTGIADRYRVAIWEKGDERFEVVGFAGFDAAGESVDGLSLTDSIGARAFGAPGGEYLCEDIDRDPNFVSRSGRQKPYGSILALALGPPSDRWGVMTIDAREKNGFTDTDLTVARHFAKLCNLGFTVWVFTIDTTGEPVAQREPARIEPGV